MRVLFAAPAFWPAVAFGGPITMAAALTESLRARGHEIQVVTTSLRTVSDPPAGRFRTERQAVGGVPVTYLATPVRYRWMGVTPTLPLFLRRSARPDVVHVFGFRDVVTTYTALWARVRGIPYVFEPLDMVLPRYRNVPLKRVFDSALGNRVVRGAAVVVANSALEREELVASSIPRDAIETRPNGFPAPREAEPSGELRRELGIDPATPLVLNVGRISFKKGLDLLLEAAAGLPDAHVAIVGPDDGDGTYQRLVDLRERLGLRDRVHLLGPRADPTDAYADADVFVLPSRNESFGMVAAEAAAAGTAVVVTDRCGVADLLAGRAALVVPCEVAALRDAVARLLADPELRRTLGAGGRTVARETTWDAVAARQEELYRLALERG